MDPIPSAVAVLLASYLIGSLPFGLFLAQAVAGIDPRRAGSGNVGATNVARLVGSQWFPVVLALDVAKGALPPAFLAPVATVDEAWMPVLRVACAGAAVSGHVWSIFLRFRGGKGVATAAGALAALAPVPLTVALVVFGLVLAVTRFISLASVVAAVAFPVIAWLRDSPRDIVILSSIVALVIVVRHRSNIYRIVTGSEPRLRRGAAGPRPDGPATEESGSGPQESDGAAVGAPAGEERDG